MKLYTYWRSSAAYRVRIALALKGVDAEQVPVDLAGGEQHAAAYRAINPQGLCPTLEVEGRHLGQSLAIIEWLEERYPEPPLLPADAFERAWVRQLALIVACEVHPLNNLGTLQRLERELGADEPARLAWYHETLRRGLGALETLVAASPRPGRCCLGDAPTLADVCLVPQLYNARRFQFDLSPYPRLTAIDGHCRALPAFQAAAPEAQPDAPPA